MKNIIYEIMRSSKYNEDKIYLIEKMNADSGMFIQKSNVFYAIKSSGLKNQNIRTKSLSFQTNIKIISVENESSFESDFYDLIICHENIESENLEIFMNLCSLFSRKESKNIDTYFFTLVDMFQKKYETSHRNALGFFGEIYFINHIAKVSDIHIQNYWHVVESEDRFDFSMPCLQVEIKTSNQNNRKITIKREQLTNVENAYLVMIKVIKDVSNGRSINDIIEEILNDSIFQNDIDFLMKLEIEKTRFDLIDQITKYNVNSIETFLVSDMDQLSNIPKSISNITYDYEFTDELNINIVDVLKNNI